MNYEQFIQSEIRSRECLLADIRAGKVFWCESCEGWAPIDEKRQDPWGGDWPACAECLAESGLQDNLLNADEADKEKQQLRSEGE
jgi:hypothetical protein